MLVAFFLAPLVRSEVTITGTGKVQSDMSAFLLEKLGVVVIEPYGSKAICLTGDEQIVARRDKIRNMLKNSSTPALIARCISSEDAAKAGVVGITMVPVEAVRTAEEKGLIKVECREYGGSERTGFVPVRCFNPKEGQHKYPYWRALVDALNLVPEYPTFTNSRQVMVFFSDEDGYRLSFVTFEQYSQIIAIFAGYGPFQVPAHRNVVVFFVFVGVLVLGVVSITYKVFSSRTWKLRKS
jgi:hypothetical protein